MLLFGVFPLPYNASKYLPFGTWEMRCLFSSDFAVCGLFSFSFQKSVTSFYPKIHNAYIHKHTFFCILVHCKAILVNSSLTVYQPGNAGFFFLIATTYEKRGFGYSGKEGCYQSFALKIQICLMSLFVPVWN